MDAEPATPTGKLAGQACDCRNCDLWRRATHAVFGEGSVGADVMLVGEPPFPDEPAP